MMESLIRTDKLSKCYGKGGQIKAVDELDLEVHEGETFGLLGPNGAGKTTTVRLLNCIIKPTSGTAEINGCDILREESKVKRIRGLLAESIDLASLHPIARASYTCMPDCKELCYAKPYMSQSTLYCLS